jgi:hypothetical protein
MSSFFCFVVAFGCILVFVQLGIIPVNRAGQTILSQEALRRTRRLLTIEEVARLQVGGHLHSQVALSSVTQPSEESAEGLDNKGRQKTTIDNPEGAEAAQSPALHTDAEEGHICAVCLEDLYLFTVGEPRTNTPLCLPCKHKVHVDCIVP